MSTPSLPGLPAPAENPDDTTAEQELPQHLRDSFAALDKACTKFLKDRVPGYAETCEQNRQRTQKRYAKRSTPH